MLVAKDGISDLYYQSLFIVEPGNIKEKSAWSWECGD